MNDKDLLHRFIFAKEPIRGELVRLQESYQTILNQHPYPAPLKQLLGEALCVAALLSAIIKFEGRLTVQFRGKGKLKLLLAQCDSHFHLRGLAKWEGELTYSDLMDAFNHGILVIMLDSGPTGRYQGIVSWRGNSLVESIEGYFKESEQLATKIWINLDEVSAAGFLLQIIPNEKKGPSPMEIESHQSHWEHIINETNKLPPEALLQDDYETLLEKLYPDDEVRIFPPVKVSFLCTCSKKRGEDAILLLGKEEAEEELANKQMIVVTCDFCNKEYIFNREEVDKIFFQQQRPPDEQLH